MSRVSCRGKIKQGIATASKRRNIEVPLLNAGAWGVKGARNNLLAAYSKWIGIGPDTEAVGMAAFVPNDLCILKEESVPNEPLYTATFLSRNLMGVVVCIVSNVTGGLGMFLGPWLWILAS